jgi:hypothetical protein
VTDLSKTIAPRSDQLNSDDLIGGPRVIRITRVTANEGNGEQPVNVFFEGDNGKPYRPCKGMRRVMVAVWGADGAAYAGRAMEIWRDPTVTWGGMQVGGIRISAMSHIEKPMTLAVTASKTSRKPLVIKPLKIEEPKPVADQPTVMSPEQIAAAQDEARASARKGKASFTGWWKANADKRDACKPIMEELQNLTAEADAANDDPFGLPPVDDDAAPSPEEAARWAAEEAAARDGEAAR